jgi:putative transposase
VNQVWATDITYIPMKTGFVYLVAIMDWYSRHVLSWRLPNTLDSSFCVEALEEAIARFGPPEVFKSNELARIEEQLGPEARFAGGKVLAPRAPHEA